MALQHLRARSEMTLPSPTGYGDPYNTPPYLVAPIQDQLSGAGQLYDFQIPNGCFVDAEKDPISYMATLVSGELLPAWLTFSDGVFSGTPGVGDAAVLEIRVRATDDGPGSDTDDFVLTILSGQVLLGDGAANTLTGTSYADSLSGAAGSDVLDGGDGADTMAGGAGNDSFTIDSTLDRIVEQAGAGNDTVHSSLTSRLGANLENLRASGTAAVALTGNALSNLLAGNGANNKLTGLAGNDSITGGGGRDLVYGGAGADKMSGGAGNDLLVGDIGADTLRGDICNDVLRGGAGAELQLGGGGAHRFLYDTAAVGIDRLPDFGTGNDVVVLDRSVFAALTAGAPLPAAQFVAGANLDHASTAAQHLVYDTSSGKLYYDSDGNGAVAAVQIAVLGANAHPTVTAADFVIVT